MFSYIVWYLSIKKYYNKINFFFPIKQQSLNEGICQEIVKCFRGKGQPSSHCNYELYKMSHPKNVPLNFFQFNFYVNVSHQPNLEPTSKKQKNQVIFERVHLVRSSNHCRSTCGIFSLPLHDLIRYWFLCVTNWRCHFPAQQLNQLTWLKANNQSNDESKIDSCFFFIIDEKVLPVFLYPTPVAIKTFRELMAPNNNDQSLEQNR